MTPRIVIAMICTLILTPLASGPGVVAAPHLSAPRFQAAPQLSAPASMAVDLTTGVVLFEDDADSALPPASTAKLLTALTALRVLSIEEQVTIVDADMVEEEFSKMGLEPGDVATVEQLLYGTLMPSGGDAALALARTAGARLDPEAPDPVERFVQEMNQVALSLGMGSSSFGNPVGRDDERSWTTARDLVRAADAVLADPLLARIVATPWASVNVGGPNARELVLENTNQFVLHDGAIGVKTGTTDAAGQALINAFKYGDNIIVSVVIGSQDRYNDTTLLLQHVASEREWIAFGGDYASLGARDELAELGLWMPVARTVMVETAALERITYTITLVDGAESGSRGVVEFSLDGETIAALPVYALGQPAGEGQ